MSPLKVVLTIAVICLVVYEGVAVVVNHVQTDDLAGRALRAAERVEGPTPAARQRAAEEAAEQALAGNARARLDEVDVTGDTATVAVSQTARVLFLDRVGPLEDWAVSTVMKQTSDP